MFGVAFPMSSNAGVPYPIGAIDDLNQPGDPPPPSSFPASGRRGRMTRTMRSRAVGAGMIENLADGVTAFTSNAFLVTGERIALVDTGANFDVVSRVRDRVERLDAAVLTHTHPDHVGNVEDVVEAFDVPVWGFDPAQPLVDRTIGDGDEIRLGDHGYVAWHTPGHKPDHLCLYAEGPGILFSGDLVFQNGAYGRTDLEGGDQGQLVESIERVHGLVDPGLTALHPGHGPSITTDAYQHLELARRMSRLG